MTYSDSRCNCIWDGPDALVTVFRDMDAPPWEGRLFLLRDALRSAQHRAVGPRARIKLSWHRFENGAACKEKR